MKPVLITAVVAVLAMGGYFGYQSVKNDPPDWLLKLITAKPPPPPLPGGANAPLEVPEGFSVTIFARDIKGARVLVRDPRGVMVVSQTSEGKVVALPDKNNDNIADEAVVVLDGLDRPHGLAFTCLGEACTLYVAEEGALKSYAYNYETYAATSPKVLAALPQEGGGHFTRTLHPHPDGERLLVSVGSSCNVCEEDSALRATAQQFNLTTGKLSAFATGLRNTVFMATDPVTGEVWGTDNGRDLIGDDIPPDEINILREGGWYGWPWFYGKNIEDKDFSPNARPSFAKEPVPSFVDLQAHSAALGLAFVPEEGWPDGWGNDLLVALHGSWNRSSPVGYKVVRLNFDDDRVMQDQFPTDFVTGFLPEGESDTDNALGRPVAILAEPGGVAYISDDRAGAIYRIFLKEPAR